MHDLARVGRGFDRWFSYCSWAVVGALCAVPLAADVPTADGSERLLGSTPRRVFTAAEYGSSSQVWRAAEGADGLVYFLGLDSALLQYDGQRWRRFALPVKVHQFHIDAASQIVVGGDVEIGRLVWPESAGDLPIDSSEGPRFVSFLDRLSIDQRDHGGLRKILTFEGDLVFCTRRYVYRMSADGSIEVLAEDPDGELVDAFLWRNRLVLHRRDRGLRRLAGEQWVAVSGNRALESARIVSLIERDDGSALVLTDSHGVFLLDDRGAHPAPATFADVLAGHRILHGIRTSDGGYVLTTVRGGAVRFDAAGRLSERFDRAGDPRINNLIYHVIEDRRGTLWLSTDQGIVQVPRTDARLIVGAEAFDSSLHRTMHFRGRLYVATRAGLYRQVADDAAAGPPAPLALERVSAIHASIWDFEEVDDTLLVATSQGIYALNARDEIERACPGLALTFFAPTGWSDHRIADARDGFQILARDADGWRCGQRIDELEGFVSWAESGGDVFALVAGSHVYRLTFPQGPAAPPIVRRYDLPADRVSLVSVEDTLYLFDRHLGAYAFEGEVGSGAESEASPFVPRLDRFAALRSDHLEDGTTTTVMRYDADDGRLWFFEGGGIRVAERGANGDWERRHVAPGQIRAWADLRRDPGSDRYWLTDSSGVYLWDPAARRPSTTFRAGVRRVQEVDSQEPLWQPGPGAATPAEPLTLPYERNALRFEVTAPVSDQLDDLEVQVRLVGFDPAWSRWTTEKVKDYTNLREGHYDFRVRARDAWGTISEPGSFRFEIEPPIYRTLWAYGLYALAVVGVVRLSVRRYQRKLERERAINRRLREVDRLKDSFLATTSHELRTPLHGMTGLAESVIAGDTGAEVPEAVRANLELIVASGRRLGRLVDDILDLSKIRHGSVVLDRRPVDLRTLTEVVLAVAAPLVGDRPIELIGAVPDDLPAADADEDRLQQILYNLVGNAIRFTTEGTVRVVAEQVSGQLVVRVEDTGAGIPVDRQEAIFDAFEQADRSIARSHGGTGLGLAVTARLVELHGGRLSVDSTPGQGSTFTFALAVADGDAAPTSTSSRRVVREPDPDPLASIPGVGSPPSEPSPSSDVSTPHRLLVVDDEPINLRLLHNTLSSKSFDLTLASSGREALALLEARSFDLVLLDVMMPEMSGYEVCRRIRRTHPAETLPILFLSAMDRAANRITGLDEGANDYLAKPIDRGELLSRVDTHLELLRAHRRQADELANLRMLLTICTGCKKIRDDDGQWNDIETVISERLPADFSHGYCPSCLETHFPGLLDRRSMPDDPS